MWNDNYVQLGFTCTKKTEGMQKPMFFLLYCITKPNHLSCKNTLTTKIVEQIFRAMMSNY